MELKESDTLPFGFHKVGSRFCRVSASRSGDGSTIDFETDGVRLEKVSPVGAQTLSEEDGEMRPSGDVIYLPLASLTQRVK